MTVADEKFEGVLAKRHSLISAHGHPKEICQLTLTGARRASEERLFPYSIFLFGKNVVYWKIYEKER